MLHLGGCVQQYETSLWLRGKVNKVLIHIMKCYKYFFLVWFFGYVQGASLVSDAFEEKGPARKKIKLAQTPLKAPGHKANKKQTDFIAQRILEKLEGAKDQTCSYTELQSCFHKRGDEALFEAVVDLMFRHNVDVTHNFANKTFTLNGEASIKAPPPHDISVAIAKFIVQTPKTERILLPLLGYNLFKEGYRVECWFVFHKIYHAVSVLCGRKSSAVSNLHIEKFLQFKECFMAEETSCHPKTYTHVFGLYRCDQSHKFGAIEKGVAKYIFDLPQKELDEINRLKMTAAKDHKDDKSKKECLQSTHYFCVSEQEKEKKEETNETDSHDPLELMIADMLCSQNLTTFNQVKFCFQQKEIHISEMDLEAAFMAVRATCYEGAFQHKKPINNFLLFVKQRKSASFTEVLEDYQKEKGTVLDPKARRAARRLFDMRPEDLQHLKTQKIPIRKRKQHLLEEQIKLYAQTDSPYSYLDFVRFFTGSVNRVCILKAVIETALHAGVHVDCFSDEFRFSLAPKKNKPPCVPIEVIIAAHFANSTCNAKYKALFINSAYKSGYAYTYKEMEDIIGGVLVLQNIPDNGSGCVDRCRCAFLRAQRTQKSFKDIQEEFRQQRSVDNEEKALMARVERLSQENIFSAWDLPTEKNTSVLGVIIKVLEKYAECGEGCPYKILQLILKCHDTPENVLETFMQIVLKEKLHITYDKSQKTYTLHGLINMRLDPEQPMEQCVFKKICEAGPFLSAELTYDLYDAGYNLELKDNQFIEGWIYDLLYFDYDKSLFKECKAVLIFCVDAVCVHAKKESLLMQDLFKYGIIKTCKLSHAVASFVGLSLKDATFPYALQELLQKETPLALAIGEEPCVPTVQEPIKVFQEAPKEIVMEQDMMDVPLEWLLQDTTISFDEMLKNVMLKNVLQEGPMEQKDMEEVPEEFLVHIPTACLTKALQESSPALQEQDKETEPAALVVQLPLREISTQRFLVHMLYDSAKEQKFYAWDAFLPFVSGKKKPRNVLEFVMDQVFLRNMGVIYEKEREHYIFSFDRPCLTPKEREIDIIDRVCDDGVCTRLKRAQCAYEMHRAGHDYISFQDYKEVFGAHCIVKKMKVKKIKEIKRCQKVWMKILQGPVGRDVFCKEREDIMNPLSSCEKSMLEKALVICGLVV